MKNDPGCEWVHRTKSCELAFAQAISLTEELLQGEEDAEEQAGPSTSAAAPQRLARHAPNVVLTEAPAIQLSSVLPATVRSFTCHFPSALSTRQPACYSTVHQRTEHGGSSHASIVYAFLHPQ